MLVYMRRMFVLPLYDHPPPSPMFFLSSQVYDWRECVSVCTWHHDTFLVLLSLGYKVVFIIFTFTSTF